MPFLPKAVKPLLDNQFSLNKLFKKTKSLINSLNITLAVFLIALCASLGIFFLRINQNTNLKNQNLNNQIQQLESQLTHQNLGNVEIIKELTSLQNSASHEAFRTVEETIDTYLFTKQKIEDYQSHGVDTEESEVKLSQALDKLLNKEYQESRDILNQTDASLEKLLEERLLTVEQEKAAQQAQISASLPSSFSGLGYGRLSVATSRGNFLIDLLKIDLNGVRVITDSANENDCSDNCPVKSLAQYVSDNSGFAGINGTYFCPADYASCAGKLNSFDFGLFNTRHSRWINGTTLFWDNRTMLAFDGGSNPYFFKDANGFGGVSDLKAAIVNYPALVNNGQNVLGGGDSLNDYLKVTKSTRSAIGIKGKTAYLVVARGASVPDLAEIFISLGVDSAMNLDGGGSSALYYNGRYLAGPGRNLPNAVIFAR